MPHIWVHRPHTANLKFGSSLSIFLIPEITYFNLVTRRVNLLPIAHSIIRRNSVLRFSIKSTCVSLLVDKPFYWPAANIVAYVYVFGVQQALCYEFLCVSKR